MYPDFRYLIHALFGVEAPQWLSLFKTFGFMVALGFLGATWAMISELKRKEKQGLVAPGYEEITVGAKATMGDLIGATLLGFFLGFKLGGFFTGDIAEISNNPITYFISLKGNVLVGLVGAALMGYFRWREKKKQELPQVRVQKVLVHPHQRIGEILIMAALGGLAGAKIFNALETWDDFVRDPIGSLLSPRGLTFYGGFIVATAILFYFTRKYKIRFAHFCDAATPAVMLAYGIGRLGCQFAGDGDWGIYNSAYVTNISTAKLEPATAAQFDQTVVKYNDYIMHAGQSQNGKVHQLRVAAPSWLPQALFAQCYPKNVNNDGIAMPGCEGDYCHVLPIGVFPTPLYEAIVCVGLFGFLWAIRKKVKHTLHLSAIYFILNGVERFLVEKIRVNYKYDWGFLHPTQAEIISTAFVLLGVGILLFYRDKNNVPHQATPVVTENNGA